MSIRHAFAAALVLLALTASLLSLAVAQDKKQDSTDPFADPSLGTVLIGKPPAADAKASESADPPCNRIPADADERERKIYEALARPIEIEFTEEPLKEIMQKIAKTSGIQIQFDEKALTEAAVATDIPITKILRGITLRSTLRLILRPLQLTYVIRNGVLMITSQTEAENHLVIRIYPVRDLVSDEQGDLDFDPLIDLIESIVAPQTWDSVGGPGSGMALLPGLLVFSQTVEVHDEIAALLASLRTAREMQNKVPHGPVLLCDEAPTRAIRDALKKQVSIEFTEEPLKEVIDKIATTSGIQIQFDEKALVEAGIATDIAITKTINELPLQDALQLLLRPIQLTTIVTDEVLMITSQTEAENRLVTRLYPVQDLVQQFAASSGGKHTSDGFDQLNDLIHATVAPQTWDTVGGPGSSQPFEPVMLLVVSQTDEVHQIVEHLLAQARRAIGQVTGKANEQTKAADTGEPILRVYTLFERSTDPFAAQEQLAPANPADGGKASTRDRANQRRAANAAAMTQLGGVAAPTNSAVVSPAGVPPEEAAELIRNLIQPQTWNEPRVFLRPTKSRLLVQHSLAVHREVAKFLERLGHWQEENDGRQLMTPKAGGLGGGQSNGGMGGGFGF
jgi:hypothetical protein